jgi:UDP-glucuronate decarboxylase
VHRGHRVCCIDNLSSGLETNIRQVGGLANFIFQREDIRRPIHTSEDCDVVINLASRASRKEWEVLPIDVLTTSADGSRNLLEYALNYNASYIYVSSSEVYGDPEIVPTPESYEGRVSPVGIRSSYDEGKRFGEALAIAYSREHSVNVTIVRLFNTYGPRIRAGDVYGRVIPRFMKQALANSPITVYGDGSHTRSFVYVTDVVDALVKLVEADSLGGVVNIGNPSEISILELAKMILRLTCSKSAITYLPLPQDDPRRRVPDITLAVRRLNWTPRVSLEKGLFLMLKELSPKMSEDFEESSLR